MLQLRLKAAFRNVVRQRARTGAALLAISLGVASILLAGGFVSDIFQQLAEAIIRSGSGHVQIARQGYFSHGSRSPEKYLIESPDEMMQRVSAQPGVTVVTGRTAFTGLLGNGRSELAVVVEGGDPELELRFGSFVRIEQGRRLAQADRFGAVVGEGVAQALKLSPGTSVSLLVGTAGGAMNALDLEVVGVARSFSREYDARAVKIPLRAAQELLASPGVNVLVLGVDQTARAEAVAQALGAALQPLGLEVRSWRELSDFYESAAALYARQFGILQLIILLMVLLSVLNTVSGTLFERAAEFGTMRALGNRQHDVFVSILIEATLLGLIGSVLGVVAGAAIAAVVSYVGIPMPPPPSSDLPYVARIAIEPGLLVRAFLIGLVATILGSVPAALRSSRMPVAEALRQGQVT